MRFVIWTVVVVVAIVGIVMVVGWLLPVKHEASRTAQFKQPPEKVYGAVSDVAGYANWLDGVSRIELLDAANGRIRFREHTNTGPIVMEVAEASPPGRFVTAIADPDQPFGGTWTFEIAPEEGGSRVTITERGEIYNPIFRFMAKFVFGYTSTMESYLRSLDRKFATPQSVRN